MTRVTSDLREKLRREIMKDLPSRDFCKEVHALAQGIIAEHMSPKLRAVYDDPELRPHLHAVRLDVSTGNAHMQLHRSNAGDVRYDTVFGLVSYINIRMDDYESAARLKEGSLYQALVTKLYKSGLVDGYFAQEELRKSVDKRLQANLLVAKTFKQLYEFLEPELHRYIPKDETQAQLPACVAPVVDDLRKLGAELPAVPKAAVCA